MTNNYSFFGRETNIRALAWMIGQDTTKDWRILSAGCGGPFLPQGQRPYDVVICNNVLLHYPTSTRELMLKNLLENIRHGGVLALEENKTLEDNPYYQWKETLGKFGLQRDKIDGAGLYIPPTIYRYRPEDNQRIAQS